VKKPTEAELRAARFDFRELLAGSTAEPVWQRFFAENPFVLSRSLPLRLQPCDILPLGRPGRSEPDFVIYPGSATSGINYGIVELKRHSASITAKGRRNIVTLSGDAALGVRQLQVYDQSFDLYSPVKRCFALSSASYLFVVMGRKEELDVLCANRNIASQVLQLLPPGIRLLTYDELLANYDAGLSQRSFILTPGLDRTDQSIRILTPKERMHHLIRHSFVRAEDLPQAGAFKRMYRSLVEIERGIRSPTIAEVFVLAKAIGVYPSELIRRIALALEDCEGTEEA
jgi:hypothetical protein